MSPLRDFSAARSRSHIPPGILSGIGLLGIHTTIDEYFFIDREAKVRHQDPQMASFKRRQFGSVFQLRTSPVGTLAKLLIQRRTRSALAENKFRNTIPLSPHEGRQTLGNVIGRRRFQSKLKSLCRRMRLTNGKLLRRDAVAAIMFIVFSALRWECIRSYDDVILQLCPQ